MRGRAHWLMTSWALALAGVACNALTGASDLDPSGLAPADDEDASVTSPPLDGGTFDRGSPRVDAASGRDADTGADAPVDATCTVMSVGPRYGSNASGSGWTTDDGILVPGDGQYAHSNSTLAPIVADGFGFALPGAAVIKGIKVELSRTAAGEVTDSEIKLTKGGAKSAGTWPEGPLGGPYVTATYGGPADTWAASFTAADINAASFGVSISVTGDGDGHADSLGVTVYYCP